MADIKKDPLTGLDMAISKLEQTVSGVDKNTDALLMRQGQTDAASDAARKAGERQKMAQAGLSGSRALGLQVESQRDSETARQGKMADINLGFMDRQDKAVGDLATLSIQKDQIQKQEKETEKADFDAAVAAVDYNDAAAVSALEQRGKALYGATYSLAAGAEEYKTKKFGDNQKQWEFFLKSADLKTEEGRTKAANEWSRLFGSTQLMPDFDELGREQQKVVDDDLMDEWELFIKDKTIAGNEAEIETEWKRLFPNKAMPSLDQIKLEQTSALRKDNLTKWETFLKTANFETPYGEQQALTYFLSLFPGEPIPNLTQLKNEQLLAKTKAEGALNEAAVNEYESALSQVLWGDVVKDAKGNYTGYTNEQLKTIEDAWKKAYPGRPFPGVDGLIKQDRAANKAVYIGEYEAFVGSSATDLTTSAGLAQAIRLHEKAYGTAPTGLDNLVNDQWKKKEAASATEFGNFVGQKLIDGEISWVDLIKDGQFTDKLDETGKKLMTDWYGNYAKGKSPFKLDANGNPTTELTADAAKAFELQFSKLGETLAEKTYNDALRSLEAIEKTMEPGAFAAAKQVLNENRLIMIVGQKITKKVDPVTGKIIWLDSNGDTIETPVGDGTPSTGTITVGEAKLTYKQVATKGYTFEAYVASDGKQYALGRDGKLITFEVDSAGNVKETPYTGDDAGAIKAEIEKHQVGVTAAKTEATFTAWKGVPTVGENGITTYAGSGGFFDMGGATYIKNPNGGSMRMGAVISKTDISYPDIANPKVGQTVKLGSDFLVFNGKDWLFAEADTPFDNIAKEEDLLALANAGKAGSGDIFTTGDKTLVKDTQGKYQVGKFPMDDKQAETTYIKSLEVSKDSPAVKQLMVKYGQSEPAAALIMYKAENSVYLSNQDLAGMIWGSNPSPYSAAQSDWGEASGGSMWANYGKAVGVKLGGGLIISADDSEENQIYFNILLPDGKTTRYRITRNAADKLWEKDTFDVTPNA